MAYIHNYHETLFRDIEEGETVMYPLVVEVYHQRGIGNIADYNSKVPAVYDPITLINSELWRNGLPEFMKPNFPPQDRVFLRFDNGEVTLCKQPVIDRADYQWPSG